MLDGRFMAKGLALAVCLSLLPTQADAKLFKDKATGMIYATAGENREEYKPWGLDIGFQFFVQYRTELEDRNQPAGTAYAAKNTTTSPYDVFEATRTIMDIKKSFTNTSRARFVLDSRNTAVGNYDLFVRHVYGEQDFPSINSTFLFGEIPMPVIPHSDGLWGYRVQGTIFSEREQYFTSGDWGIGWRTKFSFLPLDWYTTFTNGEGRTTAEVNSGKAIESRLTWKVEQVEGLSISAGGSYLSGGNIVGTANTGVGVRQVRAVGDVFYVRPKWRIGGTYLWTSDEANSWANSVSIIGNSTANMNRQSIPLTGYSITKIQGQGFSLMGVVDLSSRWSVIGRWDTFDPAENVPDNSHDRFMVGPVYRVNDNIKVLANYESLDFNPGAEIASGNITGNAYDQSRLLVQTEIKF